MPTWCTNAANTPAARCCEQPRPASASWRAVLSLTPPDHAAHQRRVGATLTRLASTRACHFGIILEDTEAQAAQLRDAEFQPFFYANRCIIPYINEGIRLVSEGVNPTLIENAAKLMGMPLGPLQLVDEISVDLGVKIAKATKAAMGDAYPDNAVDTVLFKLYDQGRLGRKSNAGFYDYDDKGKRGDLWAGLATEWPQSEAQPELTEVQHRLMFVQSLEAVRALEQGVLEDIREGDVGAILGWGFAPWSGGPFSWLDMLGAPRAVDIADDLAAKFGPRFAAPQLLRDMAARGESFYGADRRAG